MLWDYWCKIWKAEMVLLTLTWTAVRRRYGVAEGPLFSPLQILIRCLSPNVASPVKVCLSGNQVLNCTRNNCHVYRGLLSCEIEVVWFWYVISGTSNIRTTECPNMSLLLVSGRLRWCFNKQTLHECFKISVMEKCPLGSFTLIQC